MLNKPFLDNKKIYYFLIAFPLLLIGALICCIYYIPAVQTVFLSFFDQCKSVSLQSTANLLALGTGMILLMMPFAFFEFAIGFACYDYMTPIIIVTLAKIIGEYTSFFIGRELSIFLKSLLSEFKFFNAIEKLTLRKPYKTQFLMRMSGVTPQLIMNYGMGVLGTVSFRSFALVQSVVGLPSTCLAVFIGKQFQKIRGIILTIEDIFYSNNNNPSVMYAELGIILFGGISIGFLIYYVTREYTRILREEEVYDKESYEDIEKTCENIELENAI